MNGFDFDATFLILCSRLCSRAAGERKQKQTNKRPERQIKLIAIFLYFGWVLVAVGVFFASASFAVRA